MSLGPRASPARQRAASSMRAVESGPPDTASSTAGSASRSWNSAAASAGVILELCSEGMTGRDDGSRAARRQSAVLFLQLLRGRALHARRGVRIFASDLRERCASRLFLMQRRERLAEPEQSVRRLAAVLMLGRQREEGFRRLAIMLLLIERLAEPVLRVGYELLVRMLAQEVLEGLHGQPVIL